MTPAHPTVESVKATNAKIRELAADDPAGLRAAIAERDMHDWVLGFIAGGCRSLTLAKELAGAAMMSLEIEFPRNFANPPKASKRITGRQFP